MEQIPTAQLARTLHIQILRHNPRDPDSTPHLQTFELEEADTMTLFIALNEIRERQDPSLQFDFVCRAGICGSCGMIINGRPGLACRTLTRDLPDRITLAPLPAFELIGDLSVISSMATPCANHNDLALSSCVKPCSAAHIPLTH